MTTTKHDQEPAANNILLTQPVSNAAVPWEALISFSLLSMPFLPTLP